MPEPRQQMATVMIYRQEHTIVPHRLKVESHQVGEEKSIARNVPCSIPHVHCIRGIGAAPRRGEIWIGRHGLIVKVFPGSFTIEIST